ncbi:MAG: hypothetical protein II889_10445 [Clostridia bacterium]|nr:hypothetical protein [Clostridia bacterium]
MMERSNLSPILRRWRGWLVLALSLAVFFVSCALLARAVKEGAAQIDDAYRSLEIRYSLSGGRDTLSSGCSIGLHQLRQLEAKDYFSVIDCDDISVTAARMNGETISLYYSFAPARLTVLEGERADGYWITPDLAEKYGVGVGDNLTIFGYNSGSGEVVDHYYLCLPVTAVIEGSRRVYAPARAFDYFATTLGGDHRYYFNTFRFTLRRSLNPDMEQVTREIQRIFNGPTSHFWNQYITVDYNAAEVDGMIKPLVRSQTSAEFFEKLFRRILPFAVLLPEAIAVLGLSNEIGVRRMLGESYLRVFFGVWLPALVLSLPGYALSAALLALFGLTGDASWTVFRLHLGGTVLLTAALTAALAAQNPLTLLRTREET